MNDILATILGVIGFLLLIFAHVWYIKTIKNHPAQDENIPLVAFQRMKK